MRRSQFYGMTWKQRQDLRQSNKAARQTAETRKKDTLSRLKDFVIVIENSFEKEAAALHARVIAAWVRAFEVCEAAAFDEKTLMLQIAQYDLKQPAPHRPFNNNDKSVWEDYTDAMKARELAAAIWASSLECTICQLDIVSRRPLDEYAIERADQVVEDNKAKLFEMIGKKLQPYQTVEVIKKDWVTAREKGFVGEFKLNTDLGVVFFTTKCVEVDGPQKRFHYRYIGHIKPLK